MRDEVMCWLRRGRDESSLRETEELRDESEKAGTNDVHLFAQPQSKPVSSFVCPV